MCGDYEKQKCGKYQYQNGHSVEDAELIKRIPALGAAVVVFPILVWADDGILEPAKVRDGLRHPLL